MSIKLKILAAGMMIAAMGVFGVRQAHAVNPDSFTLTVTIGNALSVRVETDTDGDITDYNFGSVNLGQASVNNTNIDIDNDSGGLQEDFQLSIEDDSVNGLILRETSGGLVVDEYRVQALFQDAQPTHVDFLTDDILTFAGQSATAQGGGIFATGTVPADEDGFAVNDDARLTGGTGSELRLWLRLEVAATSTVGNGPHTFATVFISAL